MSSFEFLVEAYSRVEYKGGAEGIDGETLDDLEAYGVMRWLEELSQELRERTYRPKPVCQVLIPKKQPGQHRTLVFHASATGWRRHRFYLYWNRYSKPTW